MKLVDILARELKVWPEGVSTIAQSLAGMAFYQDAAHQIVPLGRMAISDDFREANVTRAEWQAAVDALNAPKVVEWDGEGEPPVGIECEWHPNVHGWVKVKILGRDGSDTWYRASGEEHSQTCRNMAFFRPIRTAEQVAAEEREKAISDMMEVTSDGISCIGQDDALALYKAGYRKQ